ncbi:hypothetical protein N8475_00285 [Winogradskyella sp.]|nr:hypothetical protein [Winogradskyella sp.]
MTKINFLIVLLIIVVQTSFSQENHSRISINNPSQATLDILAEQGVDLRCGVKHNHNSLTLDI